MKTIGILSDTHSCWDDRYSVHFAQCDEIWHAGDIGDITVLERLRGVCPTVRAVRGNIDHGQVARECAEMLDFNVEGLQVCLTHIAGYPGRYGAGIEAHLRATHAGLMVCGHSHILKVMPCHRLGHLHVNPGAAGWHGWQTVRTLVRLAVDAGAVTSLEVIELGRGTGGYIA